MSTQSVVTPGCDVVTSAKLLSSAQILPPLATLAGLFNAPVKDDQLPFICAASSANCTCNAVLARLLEALIALAAELFACANEFAADAFVSTALLNAFVANAVRSVPSCGKATDHVYASPENVARTDGFGAGGNAVGAMGEVGI